MVFSPMIDAMSVVRKKQSPERGWLTEDENANEHGTDGLAGSGDAKLRLYFGIAKLFEE